jgi:uncharacterized membrane protein YoaK (UPF0700 family)
MSQGHMAASGRFFTALLGFAIGVAQATVVNARRAQPPGPPTDPSRLLLLELLFLVSCTALWNASPEPIEGGVLYVVILLSALSMGIQAVAARTVNVSGISTIVFTSGVIRIVTAVTGAVAGSASSAASPPSMTSELAAFLAYGCGALMVGVMASWQVWLVLWIPTAAVILALGVWQVAAAPKRTKI